MIIKGKFSIVLHKSIRCGYSLESSQRGDSDEYPQRMFLWRNNEKLSLNYLQIPSWSVSLVYTICHLSAFFPMHMCMAKQPCSNFRIITAIFRCLNILDTYDMSHVTRKPVFKSWDQVRLKLACSTTGTTYSLEISAIASRCIYTIQEANNKGTEICTFVVRIWHKQVFSWCGSYFSEC